MTEKYISIFGANIKKEMHRLGYTLNVDYPRMHVSLYTMVVDADMERVALFWGPEDTKLGETDLIASEVAAMLKKWRDEIEQPFDETLFLRTLYSIYGRRRAKIGDQVAIDDILSDYVSRGIYRNKKESRIHTGYKLFRLAQSGIRKIHDKHIAGDLQISLVTATRRYTRTRKGFIWLPTKERSDGTCEGTYISHIVFEKLPRSVDDIKEEIQLKINVDAARGIAQRCIDRHHDALVDIMEQSKASGVEVGARFFRGKDEGCTISETCIGDKCSIAFYDPARHIDITQEIGSIHTHPSGVTMLSIPDIGMSLLSRHLFSCVVSPETGFMQCFLMSQGTEESDMAVSKIKKMFGHFKASYEIAVDVAREMLDAGRIKEEYLFRGLPLSPSDHVKQFIKGSFWYEDGHALTILRYFAMGTEFEPRLLVAYPYADAIFDLNEYLIQNREKLYVPMGPPVRLI